MYPSILSKQVSPLLLVAIILAAAFLNGLVWISFSDAGQYMDSAHGQNVNRATMASEGYATGNCAHCHEQHASVGGSGGTASIYLGFGKEENLCLGCHRSTGPAVDDVKTDITKTHGHLVADYSDKHLAGETKAEIAVVANAHIECTDCHNPHVARTGNHTAGSNAITGPSPLEGVTGVEPIFSAFNWTAPSGYTELQTATKEYQICFKCHSGAVGDPVTWSGTAGSTAWTDLGLEFSPANMSGHPIVTGLNNYSNSIEVNRGAGPYRGLHNEPDGNAWDQLLDPWGTNAGDQTMYCSDCHASNSSTAGPHGSSYKWMLAGTNKAWPYTTAAKNGASTGTYRLIDTILEWSADYQQGLGTDDGCFCWNCHPARRNGNNTHANGNHGRAYCVDCHIRVPHGGKVSRLIAADNAATYTNMPARYTADGLGHNSAGGTQPYIMRFTKTANWSYGSGNCASTNTSGPRSCNWHNHFAFGSESW